MINKREYGIVFVKDFNCGIAQISVYDQTIAKYISENGVESASIAYRYCDTYQAASPAYSVGESYYCYWIALTVGHVYTITCVNSGTHNPLSSAPYNVTIQKFLDSEPLVYDNLIENQITTLHEDFPTALHTYTLVNGETTETYKTQLFSGDGVTTTFTLSGNNHAAIFERFSIDGGATWKFPDDFEVTWGNNIPDYDNETMDANYQFTLKFISTPPPIGTSNVIIKYKPKANKAVVELTTKQPHDEVNSYIDYRSHVVMRDYGISFI
jgi:hypothetical protein